MFYMLHDCATGAEDDGTAWQWLPSGREQVGPMTVQMVVEPPRRVFGVGMEVVVDEDLAQTILAIASETIIRSVRVVGPQPKMELLQPMVQVTSDTLLPLAAVSVSPKPDGRNSFVAPFVLRASAEQYHPKVCKIFDNKLTIFSVEVRNLLAEADPSLYFEKVRFEDEPLGDPEPVPPPVRIPTREELMRGRRSN